MTDLPISMRCHWCGHGTRPAAWGLRWWSHDQVVKRRYCKDCIIEAIDDFVNHGDGAQRLEAVKINE